MYIDFSALEVIVLSKINITSNEANQRIDRFLRKYLKDTSLSDIYKLLRKKQVKVNGRKVKENYRLAEGDILEILSDNEIHSVFNVKASRRDFNIIFEDKNILIVDKPTELIIHPDAKHRENTLVDQVIYYLYETGQYNPEIEKTFRPAAVNRLDVNTGGIVIFAKNYASLQALSIMIKERYIKKYYLCIVRGKMDEKADIISYLIKDVKNNVVKISDTEIPGSKKIHTKFKTLKSFGDYSLVEVDLITGRSHQIRAQLASIGHPIIGDMKYGSKACNKQFLSKFGLKNQFLYAYRIVIEKAQEPLEYLENTEFLSKLPSNYKIILKHLFDIDME